MSRLGTADNRRQIWSESRRERPRRVSSRTKPHPATTDGIGLGLRLVHHCPYRLTSLSLFATLRDHALSTCCFIRPPPPWGPTPCWTPHAPILHCTPSSLCMYDVPSSVLALCPDSEPSAYAFRVYATRTVSNLHQYSNTRAYGFAIACIKLCRPDCGTLSLICAKGNHCLQPNVSGIETVEVRRMHTFVIPRPCTS